MRLIAAVTFLGLVGGRAPAVADTIQLNPSKDNTLYQDDSGNTSNGQGQHFFAGRIVMRDLVRRGLLAFDIAGNIPAGSTIQAVTLTLHLSRALVGQVEVDLRAALADWGEGASMALDPEGMGAPSAPGDATWLHTFYDGMFWTAPGGDFSTTVTSSTTVNGVGFHTFDSMSDPGLVTDVQRWLDAPGTNFGWVVMVADETVPGSAKRFDTRENSEPSFRPLLEVTFATAGG